MQAGPGRGEGSMGVGKGWKRGASSTMLQGHSREDVVLQSLSCLGFHTHTYQSFTEVHSGGIEASRHFQGWYWHFGGDNFLSLLLRLSCAF